MNKTQKILVGLGGALAVATLAAMSYSWFAYSSKTAAVEGDDEGNDGLETIVERARTLSGKTINPCEASVRELTASCDQLTEWKEEVFKFAARGDRPIADISEAAFKDFIVDDAHRLMSLPANSTNKVLDAKFDFGVFKAYVSEGKMPESSELKRLQRTWDDAALLIELLSSCGVERVTQLDVKAETENENANSSAKPKKGKGAKKNAAKQEDAFKPASYTYVVTCQSAPAALVRTLNALAASERFLVVEDFSFRHVTDEVAENLGDEKKRAEGGSSSGRRRRGSAVIEEKPKEEEDQLFTVITDPNQDRPLEGKLTITVQDFKTMEETKEEEPK